MARDDWDESGYGGYGNYVSAEEKRRRAAAAARKLEKGGRALAPVKVAGRAIANTFWGKAWCDNLESYSDYASRLPRGRSYVRNGSVLDLQIQRGVIKAAVSGTEVYKVKIEIEPLAKADWAILKRQCAGKVGTLMDLLRGKLSGPVMEIITRKAGGLFPRPYEIEMDCSCPDPATMCKHIAATLYGVGVRLDHSPEMLFTLRGVDHLELIAETTRNLAASLTAGDGSGDVATLDAGSLSDVFGIELEPAEVVPAPSKGKAPAGGKKPPKAPASKKATPGRKPAVKTIAKEVAGKPAATTRKSKTEVPRQAAPKATGRRKS